MSKGGKVGGDDACLKLFRITLLGRAESGKTSLCNMFIANGCNPRYEHTEDPHLYYREVKPKDVADLTRGDGYTGGGSDHTGEAKRARKKKKGKRVMQYGVQLEDTPGEISDEVQNETIENVIITGTDPRDYQRRMVADDENNGDTDDEKTLLLAKSKSRDTKRNLLYAPSQTHGHLIIFDAGSQASLKKAMELHKSLTRVTEKEALPVIFVGNKLDRMKTNSAEILELAKAYCRKQKHHVGCASSSFSRNEVYFEDKIMTTTQFIHAFVQKMNEGGHFLRGDESEGKNRRGKGKRGGAALDDENAEDGVEPSFGCCSCFGGGDFRDTDAEGMSIDEE